VAGCAAAPDLGGGHALRQLRPCCSSVALVPGRAPAHRAVFGVVLARPEKQALGPCLGRQFGTTPDTARHE
jgi:hypothetical protein